MIGQDIKTGAGAMAVGAPVVLISDDDVERFTETSSARLQSAAGAPGALTNDVQGDDRRGKSLPPPGSGRASRRRLELEGQAQSQGQGQQGQGQQGQGQEGQGQQGQQGEGQQGQGQQGQQGHGQEGEGQQEGQEGKGHSPSEMVGNDDANVEGRPSCREAEEEDEDGASLTSDDDRDAQACTKAERPVELEEAE